MKHRNTLLFLLLTVACVSLSSCGNQEPAEVSTIHTAPDAKVNLANIALSVSNAQITKDPKGNHFLSFDYTVVNNTGSHLSFVAIYSNADSLIDTNLTDKDGAALTINRNPLLDLTLSQPRPLIFRSGSSATRPYKVSLAEDFRDTGEPITLRVRLHAPSRYDELRSTITAPLTIVTWP